MYPSKLETMCKWPIPTKKNIVQAFLDFAYYYCQYIVNYISNTHPVINLTKDVPFTSAHAQQQAFNAL